MGWRATNRPPAMTLASAPWLAPAALAAVRISSGISAETAAKPAAAQSAAVTSITETIAVKSTLPRIQPPFWVRCRS